MNRTKIPYLTHVWNPMSGCTPISSGCDSCWAQSNLHRWRRPEGVTLHPEELKKA